jgi:hypothetical protein
MCYNPPITVVCWIIHSLYHMSPSPRFADDCFSWFVCYDSSYFGCTRVLFPHGPSANRNRGMDTRTTSCCTPHTHRHTHELVRLAPKSPRIPSPSRIPVAHIAILPLLLIHYRRHPFTLLSSITRSTHTHTHIHTHTHALQHSLSQCLSSLVRSRLWSSFSVCLSLTHTRTHARARFFVCCNCLLPSNCIVSLYLVLPVQFKNTFLFHCLNPQDRSNTMKKKRATSLRRKEGSEDSRRVTKWCEQDHVGEPQDGSNTKKRATSLPVQGRKRRLSRRVTKWR